LVQTNLSRAKLDGCSIYGISAWGVNVEGATQSNLVITPPNEPTVTVDNLEVAQFVYLLLNNQKIRDVINTIGKKAVLILGQFTERKPVLDAIRDELRKRDYLPIVFDFERPTQRDFTETVMTLAGMCLFIIADITKPVSPTRATGNGARLHDSLRADN
jgi:spore germination protein YaaH